MSNRRLFSLTLLIVALSWTGKSAIDVSAAPLRLDCRGLGFTAPLPGATVSGAVEITGRTQMPDFRFFKVEYSAIGREDWVLIGGDVIRRPVENGRLVVWQSNLVADGAYRLRMHVVDSTGNYCESFLAPIYVSNGRATPVPSATVTETPNLTIVLPQPTPTTRPIGSTIVAPPLQTPGNSGARGLPLPDLNLVVLSGCFGLGACGMLFIVLLVSAVMYSLRKSESKPEE